MDSYDYLCKVIIIGDAGVGKSSILMRFADGTFRTEHMSTIGVDFRIKTMPIGSKIVKVQIWDTAGQERFRTIVSSYFRGAHAVIIVYDTKTSKPSEIVNRLDSWLREAMRFTPDSVYMIVGNKADDPGFIPPSEVVDFAKKHNCLLTHVSARMDLGIDDAFTALVTAYVNGIKAPLNSDKTIVPLGIQKKKAACCGRGS